MEASFWIFLSVAVFMGTLLPIVAIITKHRSTMRTLEVEALKIQEQSHWTQHNDHSSETPV